jgi:hypothetical protein
VAGVWVGYDMSLGCRAPLGQILVFFTPSFHLYQQQVDGIGSKGSRVGGCGRYAGGVAMAGVALTPYTLHPKAYTLHPKAYILHPKANTLPPKAYTLHPKAYTLYPKAYTLHPKAYTLHPTP